MDLIRTKKDQERLQRRFKIIETYLDVDSNHYMVGPKMQLSAQNKNKKIKSKKEENKEKVECRRTRENEFKPDNRHDVVKHEKRNERVCGK